MSQIPRFPNLGKLSIAIIENIVEPVIGDKAINEIKSPVIEKQLLESLTKVLEQTEKRFATEYEDKSICEAIITLPLANLPSVLQAMRVFYSRPTDSTLEQVLISQLSKELTNFTHEQVKSGISTYLKILRQELTGVSVNIREQLDTISNLSIQENTNRIANTLEQISKLIEDRQIVDKVSQVRFELLRRGLNERRNLNSLQKAVYEGEALYSEGNLPSDLIELLRSARRAFDEIRQEQGALTSLMNIGGLRGAKSAQDILEKQFYKGIQDFFYNGNFIPIMEALQMVKAAYFKASESAVQHEIEKVNLILPAHPFQAVTQLREALQEPFLQEHRNILVEKLSNAERLAMRMGRISSFIEQELTVQECDIVKLAVMNDWTPKQIANHIGKGTIETDIQIEMICRKLQSHFGLERANLTTLIVLLSPYWI